MRMRSWRKFMLALAPGLLWAAVDCSAAEDASGRLATDRNEPEYIISGPGDVIYPTCDGMIYGEPSCTAGCATGCDVPMDTVCCCPLWTVRAGAVFLRRDGQGAVALSDGLAPINTGNVDFDYEAGPLVTAIRHNVFGSNWDLEATYFGVHGFDATAASAAATVFLTTPVTNIGGGATVTSDFRSRLDSTEINFRRSTNDWFTFLGGFRWIELGDSLNTDIGGLAAHSVNVNNHLYGAQIGVDAILLRRNAFSIEGFGKAGIYGNNADQDTTTVGIGGAVPAFTADGGQTAFVGEIAVTGVYAINDRWSVRGGYQVLWIDGVALAPEQIAVSDVGTGVAVLDDDESLVYHGFTAAAEYWW